MNLKRVLVMSGHDPSGNAGIMRDLQVMQSLKLQVAGVVTAVTAQNKTCFLNSYPVLPSHFLQQLKSVSPLASFAAVKIGMLGNEANVLALVHYLKKQKKTPSLVLDPVCRSTTGGLLLTINGQRALFKKLIPLVSLWTPNLREAEFFSKKEIRNEHSLEAAAMALWKAHPVPVLVKGYAHKDRMMDLYVDHRQVCLLVHPRHRVKNLRGAGCTLSSYIAGYLAKGASLFNAICQAQHQVDAWIKNQK